MFLFCLVFAMFCARLFICASWSPAGKGLTSWLSFVVSSVSLSLSHWYPGSGVVLDCIDSWSLQPYLLCAHSTTILLCTIILERNDGHMAVDSQNILAKAGLHLHLCQCVWFCNSNSIQVQSVSILVAYGHRMYVKCKHLILTEWGSFNFEFY